MPSQPSSQPTAQPTSGPTQWIAPVIKFEQTIFIHHFNGSKFTSQDEDIVILAAAKELSLDSQYLKFLRWNTADRRRRVLLTSSDRTVSATTVIEVSTLVFPDFDSKDSVGVYTYLSKKLTTAVSSGAFTTSLQKFAMQLGSTSLSSATAESVTVSQPIISTPSKEIAALLSSSDTAGIVVGALFAFILIFLTFYYNYRVKNKDAKAFGKYAQSVLFSSPLNQKIEVECADVEVGARSVELMLVNDQVPEKVITMDDQIVLKNCDISDRLEIGFRQALIADVVSVPQRPYTRPMRPIPFLEEPEVEELVCFPNIPVDVEESKSVDDMVENVVSVDDDKSVGDEQLTVDNDNDHDSISVLTEILQNQEDEENDDVTIDDAQFDTTPPQDVENPKSVDDMAGNVVSVDDDSSVGDDQLTVDNDNDHDSISVLTEMLQNQEDEENDDVTAQFDTPPQVYESVCQEVDLTQQTLPDSDDDSMSLITEIEMGNEMAKEIPIVSEEDESQVNAQEDITEVNPKQDKELINQFVSTSLNDEDDETVSLISLIAEADKVASQDTELVIETSHQEAVQEEEDVEERNDVLVRIETQVDDADAVVEFEPQEEERTCESPKSNTIDDADDAAVIDFLGEDVPNSNMTDPAEPEKMTDEAITYDIDVLETSLEKEVVKEIETPIEVFNYDEPDEQEDKLRHFAILAELEIPVSAVEEFHQIQNFKMSRTDSSQSVRTAVKENLEKEFSFVELFNANDHFQDFNVDLVAVKEDMVSKSKVQGFTSFRSGISKKDISHANEHEAHNRHRPHTVDSTTSKRLKDFELSSSEIKQDTILSLQYGFISPVDQWSITKDEVKIKTMPLIEIDEFEPPPFTRLNSASRLSEHLSRDTSKHNAPIASASLQIKPPAAASSADASNEPTIAHDTVQSPAKEQVARDDVYIPGKLSVAKAQQLQAEKEKRLALEQEQRVARERERLQKAEFQAAKEAMLTQSKVPSVGFGSLKAGLSRKDIRNMTAAAIHNVAAIVEKNTDINQCDSPFMANSSSDKKRVSTADNFKRVSFLASPKRTPPVEDDINSRNFVHNFDDDILTSSSKNGRPHTTQHADIASYDNLLSPFDASMNPFISIAVTTAHNEDNGFFKDENSINSSSIRQLGSPSSLTRLLSFTGGSEIKLKPHTSSKSRRSNKLSRQQHSGDDKEALRSTPDNYSSTDEHANDNVASLKAWGTGSLVKPKPSEVNGNGGAAMESTGFLPSVLFGTWPTTLNSGKIVPLATDSFDAEDAMARTINDTNSMAFTNSNNKMHNDDDVEEFNTLLEGSTPSKISFKPILDAQMQQLLLKQAESIHTPLRTPKNPAHYQSVLENEYSDLDSDERGDESFILQNQFNKMAPFVSPDHNYQQHMNLSNGDNADNDEDSVDTQEQQAQVTVKRKPKKHRNKRAKLIITMDD